MLTVVSTTTNTTELHNHNSDIWIMLKDTDMLKELLNKFFMIQEEELH
jgi:hypothetical protein